MVTRKRRGAQANSLAYTSPPNLHWEKHNSQFLLTKSERACQNAHLDHLTAGVPQIE